MQNDWLTLELREICDSIDYGFTQSSTNTPIGPKFLRITDIVSGSIDWGDVPYCEIPEQDIKKYELHDGDIVIARTGATTGYSAYIKKPPKAVFASYLVRYKIKEDYCSKYVSYYLKSKEYWEFIKGVLGDKSAQPNASASTISHVQIKLPPLPVQQKIASILGALDDKIELNRRMNKTLEEIAQAIFKHWFVDNPVTNGEEFVPFTDVIEINPLRSLKKGDIAPYLDMSNMPTEGHRAIHWFDRPFNSGTRFTNGDTLLARITPCLENGKTAFVDFLLENQIGWGSTEYIIFRPRNPLPPEYGYYLAKSKLVRNHAIQNMTGTSGRQRTPASCFQFLLIPKPSLELVKRFGSFAHTLMLKIRANDEETNLLRCLRDLLLPKLINGLIQLQ